MVAVDTRTAPGLLAGTRWLLLLFSALTFLAVVVLFGRPADTDRFFAWTIAPPLTAAFLGAGYGAGCVLVALSLRAGDWARVRVPLLTILVFTVVTLAATLLHLDKFHLSQGAPIAVAAAWFWLVVYVVVPPSMAVLWAVQQRRAPASASTGMPGPLAVALAVEGGVMTVLGVVLFAAPSTAETLWPWALTPLTARAVAAWLIAFGLATLYAARFEDVVRGRVQALAYVVFGVLELLALARFRDQPRWDDGSGWVYLVFLVMVTLTGAVGLLLAAREASVPAADAAAAPAPPAA